MAWRSELWKLGMVLFLALAARAPGQEDRPSFGMSLVGGEAAMGMAIGRASVDRYGDLLGFDEQQRQTAMLLHEAYLEDYKRAADAIAQGMIDLEDESKVTRDRDQYRRNIGKLMRGMLERRMELEDRLLGDLETLAALPDDDDSFARVERARRRELARSIARVNGAWVDLFEVARQVGPADAPGVDQLLLDYENQIDAANRALIDAMLDHLRGNIALMENSDVARERANNEAIRADGEAFIEKLSDADARAKAINERFARMIGQTLPEDEAARWTEAYNRSAWPVVYHVSHAQRVLDAAAGFEDLTDEQREQLDAVRAWYEREAGAINTRWARAIDAHQDGAGNPWTGGGKSGDVERAKQDREEVDARCVERVRGTLTPEQAERLPDTRGVGGVDADAVVREMGGG